MNLCYGVILMPFVGIVLVLVLVLVGQILVLVLVLEATVLETSLLSTIGLSDLHTIVLTLVLTHNH